MSDDRDDQEDRDDRFEDGLRRGLATLAREAVADVDAFAVEHLPRVQRIAPPEERRPGRRVLAAVVAVVVIAGSVAVAVAVATRGKRSTVVQTPQPSVTAVPTAPLSARSDQMAVFTGKEVIVWGGRYQPVSDVTPPVASALDPRAPTSLADGAAYDVDTHRWRALPRAPIAARSGAVAAWTGREMVVVGGLSDAVPAARLGLQRDGAAYDPLQNRWRRIPDAPICVSAGTWTGTQLVVAGNCSGTPFEVAAFDPARDAWTRLPSPADAAAVVAAAGTLFAWDGGTNRGQRFDGSTRKWVALPALPEERSIGTVAGAFGADLAVIGPKSPTAAGVAVDLLAPGATAWRHFDSTAASPSLDFGRKITSEPGLLVWNEGGGYAWFSGDPRTGTAEISHVGRGPVSLERVSETLVSIGGRRVFVWGGQSIPNGESGTSRPSNDGAILELP